jgi:hypothetical protein
MSKVKEKDSAQGKPDEREGQSDERLRYDLHTIKKVFPEAAAVFSFRPQSLEEVKDQFLVIPDTNALLVPYRTSPHSLEQFQRLYTNLITAKRFFVPGQVAREFARLRPQLIGEMAKYWGDYKSRINSIQEHHLPILKDSKEYREFLKLAREANVAIDKCKAAADAIKDLIRGWSLDDPVSEMYSRLFTSDIIVEPTINEDAILKDRKERKAYSIPPGYKDQGLGDLLIWHTLLMLGEREKRPLVFVSGEEKADWVYSSDNKPLFPRYELIDEYRRASGGKTFYVVTLTALLKLLGAEEGTVSEVKKAEEEQQSSRAKQAAERQLLPRPPATAVSQFFQSIAGQWHLHPQDELVHISPFGGYQVVLSRRGAVPTAGTVFQLTLLASNPDLTMVEWAKDYPDGSRYCIEVLNVRGNEMEGERKDDQQRIKYVRGG